MKNLGPITAADDLPTKDYSDTRIAVQSAEPVNGAKIWIDTDEPDPLLMLEERLALLEERVALLERKKR
jgi:hypothetical protein